MTAVALTANSYPGGIWKSAQPGVSDTANRITAILRSSITDTAASATGQARIEVPFSHLEDLFVECSMKNWDGEGAEPISSATLLEARTLLLLLPERIMTPEFIPERSGRITFEWYENSERVYLLSIGGTGELEFAGIFGQGNEIHGKCSFSGILPKMVIQHLFMLYSI